MLAGQLVVSLLVAEAMCASNNDVFKAKLLSSTLFMTGVSTIAMSVIGIRWVSIISYVPSSLYILHNSGIFARVLFSRNFAYAKFRENKILAK